MTLREKLIANFFVLKLINSVKKDWVPGVDFYSKDKFISEGFFRRGKDYRIFFLHYRYKESDYPTDIKNGDVCCRIFYNMYVSRRIVLFNTITGDFNANI